MDFVHFLKSQRYRSRVPLRQLQFTVAVYRAIVVEETNVELLAEVTVPWDGKVFSPLETLTLYKDLAQLSQGPTTAAGEVATMTKTVTGTPAESVTPAAAAAALGINTPSAPPLTTTEAARSGAAHNPTAGAAGPLSPDALALPSPRELVAELRNPSSFFFTRPSLEDFIDRAEEDCPVDPPQGPSLLAPVVLRQHRRDHQPNRKMFLMWASGDVVLPEGATAPPPTVPLSAADTATTATGQEGGIAVVPRDAFASTAPLPALEVHALAWKGVERVLCTLTAEPDEYVFTARPSLNDVHTLFVDAAHIYTFRVTVSKAEAGGGGRAGLLLSDTAAGAALDATAAPLDAVLANVRELAHYAEEQYEQLEIGKDAVARRLLRQAALLAPADKSGGERAAVAAPAAAAAAAEDVGGRSRRVSLSFGISTGAGAERLGASMSAPALPRAAGVGGTVLSRSTVMRSGHALPRGMCQYYLFGTVDRCVGIAESTLFLRCQLVEDGAASTGLYDPLATSSPSAVCEFSSQLAHISTFVEHECVMDIDHVFNLPFDYSFVGAALPSGPLRLVVSALTEGAAAEGIQSAVAYACVSLPIASPGRHTLKAAMWAPHKTGLEFLRSTLLGGAPSLVDARQAGPPPSHRTGISVKEGLYADSVGSVYVTVNILHHKNHEAL